MTTWRDDVVTALKALGGQGSLPEIYDSISKIRMDLPDSWHAIVRRELEYNSSDSEAFMGKNDLFVSVSGIGNGIWSLRDHSQNNDQSSLWSDLELRYCLEAYLQMLKFENTEQKYSKAEVNEQLRANKLTSRSKGSIEFRMQNISAFFAAKHMPFIDGYKPKSNIGTEVTLRIEKILDQLNLEETSKAPNQSQNLLNVPSISSGQGFRSSEVDRKIIELRAMELAKIYLEKNGYVCEDTSSNHPFDFLASQDNDQIKIEVKGTTSSTTKSILMTKNEVELHQSENGKTGLIIVHSIFLSDEEGIQIATGGEVDAHMFWNINEWKMEPLSYKLIRPHRVTN